MYFLSLNHIVVVMAYNDIDFHMAFWYLEVTPC